MGIVDAGPSPSPRALAREPPTDDAHLTLEAARAAYFRANGFGEDGGYAAAWVDFMVGPIPFPFPNSKERVRALRFHDLHHVVTGYRTDFVGELEIAAYEVASGCADFVVAWALNLSGIGAGALVAPRRTFRAFLRGRRARNLYRTTYEPALLSRTVGEVRHALGLEAAPEPARATDALIYAGYVLVGLVTGLLLFVVFAPLAPIGWVVLQLAARARR